MKKIIWIIQFGNETIQALFDLPDKSSDVMIEWITSTTDEELQRYQKLISSLNVTELDKQDCIHQVRLPVFTHAKEILERSEKSNEKLTEYLKRGGVVVQPDKEIPEIIMGLPAEVGGVTHELVRQAMRVIEASGRKGPITLKEFNQVVQELKKTK